MQAAPSAEQAVQVPFATPMFEQGRHDVAVPPDDHCPDGHAAHALPFTYCPAEQLIFSHVEPFALYPALHDTAVHFSADEHAVHFPLLTEIVEHGLQQPFASQELPPTV